MQIKLYTTHCPKCKVLEEKLSKAKVDYEICEDVDELRRLYPEVDSVPRLLAIKENGEKILMNFAEGAAFLNALSANKNF